jgi:hypothetical protein
MVVIGSLMVYNSKILKSLSIQLLPITTNQLIYLASHTQSINKG